MNFLPADLLLDDVNEADYLTTELSQHPALPDGTYRFVESYCTDPRCDCRKTILQVLHNGQVVGSLDFGWASFKHYLKWAHGDQESAREMTGWSVNLLSPYTLDPDRLLSLAQDVADEHWLATIKERYRRIRLELKKNEEPTPSSAKPSRNSPCPCGSGKKYKRCCIDKPLDEAVEENAPNIVPFPGTLSGPFGSMAHPAQADFALDPADQVEIALGMLREGQLERGEARLHTLLEEYPEEATVHYGLGVSRVIRKDFDGSIPHFQEAVNLMPDFVEAWHNLGLSYRHKSDIPGAINCARKVVKDGVPGDSFVIQDQEFLEHAAEVIANNLGLDLDDYLEHSHRFDMAYLSLQEGDYEKALDDFKQVIAVEPSSYPAFGNLGLCYAALGQRANALECLDQALAIDPEYEVAAKNKTIIEALEEGQKLNIPTQTVRWGDTGMKPVKPGTKKLTAPSDE